MKTITTFIISLTAFILSVAVMYYSINIFRYLSTTFYNEGATESYTFSFTFVLSSIISFIFGIILLLYSIKYFSIHRKYYHTYLYNKRDREIKEKVETAKYNNLYEDLKLSSTVEQKEEILTAFYTTKDIIKQADNNRMVEIMKENIYKYSDIKPITSTLPIKKIPTPHDLMGFENIIFDRKLPKEMEDTNNQ